MLAVVTLDQRSSRGEEDLVPRWLEQLNNTFRNDLRLPFARTVGDEVQGMVEAPDVVLELVMMGLRSEFWWIGIGLGPVETPLGITSADSRGDAFYNAREAVEQAKRSRYGFAVRGEDEERARAAFAALTLLAFVVQRRGRADSKGWEAVELAARGLNAQQIGERLGISRQAAWERLRVAGWEEEREGRWLTTSLLSLAMAAHA
jgi:hypothetical protein